MSALSLVEEKETLSVIISRTPFLLGIFIYLNSL